MSRDDRDATRGSSPYDEPTDAISTTGGAGSDGTGSEDSGVVGFAPYRRGGTGHADAGTGTGRAEEIADEDETSQIPSREHAGHDAGGDPSTVAFSSGSSDPDTAHTDTSDDTRQHERSRTDRTDRDAFHREHARRYSRPDTAAADDTRTQAIETDPDNPATEAVGAEHDDAAGNRRWGRRRRSRPEDTGTGERGASADDLESARRAARRGTTDLGILLLRVAVGLIAMAHGAQKLFGWWNGPKIGGFSDFLVNSTNTNIGFNPDAAKPLAIVGALSEGLGGVMLVLGLLTPIAGSAVLGTMLIAGAYKATLAGGVWFFAADHGGSGIEYEALLAVAAAALILMGPGRISLDFGRGWARRPFVGSVLWLIIGVAAAVAVWILFNGTNPFHSPGNPASS
ncbi:DoxX family protein [Williamsia sterculiae]|uniref:DoxX family protein n=1 Tax=Williamsia sterculiae TaxID=1344003 RepID=UPI001F213DCF|nr:DoxX family protein [Williamsia sterculiae]